MELNELIWETAVNLGAPEEEELDSLERLCLAAERELRGRLRPGVTVEDCQPALLVAAAWMALGALQESRAAGEAASFSAGDLSISRSGGQGESLRRQAERLMAPYLKDGGFVFQGVKG